MAMYSQGAKRELTKKKAARLAQVDMPPSHKEDTTSHNVDPSRLRMFRIFAVLCAPRTRPD